MSNRADATRPVGIVSGVAPRGARDLRLFQLKPLIVVDGVVLGQIGIENLDHTRIDSIEIIKGAAAAAQYGERAASGVVVIRTKKK